MSEEHEQMALMAWARSMEGQYPELALLYHPANGGWRHKATAIRLKQLGVKRGVPDLHLPVPRGGYAGLWIELKWADNKTTAEQTWWIGQLTRMGHKCYVCYSMEAAQQVILDYLGER